jgi:MoxR-like ATPase
MQEYEVTAGGTTYPLDLPFFVLATQNPIEQEGTYPLPEAQLDRFMFYLSIEYPEIDEEIIIAKSTTGDSHIDIKPVLSSEDIIGIQEIVRRVPVSDHVIRYAVNLSRATRPDEKDALEYVKKFVSWGAGVRASQYLILGAKAHAIMNGRYSASCNDVKAVCLPVLRHRIITNFNAEADGIRSEDIVNHILQKVQESGE